MSNPFEEVNQLYDKFSMLGKPVTEAVVDYRFRLMEEEYDETVKAHNEGDAEGVVDGHVDQIVILIGNLMLFGVDPEEAWKRVMAANMAKERGRRGEEDAAVSMVKPEGWVGPDHSDNHGGLDDVYERIQQARAEVDESWIVNTTQFTPGLEGA